MKATYCPETLGLRLPDFAALGPPGHRPKRAVQFITETPLVSGVSSLLSVTMAWHLDLEARRKGRFMILSFLTTSDEEMRSAS